MKKNETVFFLSKALLSLMFAQLSFTLDTEKTHFREYPMDPSSLIYQHYYQMHTRQTIDFVRKKHLEYFHSDVYDEFTMEQALGLLKSYVDPSDPDADFSNDIHNYQTAESCRKMFPNDKEMHLIGLIHDVGKIMYRYGEPTWAIVGDTFPVGHPFSPSCIYYDFFKDNPDFDITSLYQVHCGFDSVLFSWGHDEYLYYILSHPANRKKLSDRALYVVRYHSFYPWHELSVNEKNRPYAELASEQDWQMLDYVKKFNSCDLYSKSDEKIYYASIKEYYAQLIAEYLPKTIKFFRPRYCDNTQLQQ